MRKSHRYIEEFLYLRFYEHFNKSCSTVEKSKVALLSASGCDPWGENAASFNASLSCSYKTPIIRGRPLLGRPVASELELQASLHRQIICCYMIICWIHGQKSTTHFLPFSWHVFHVIVLDYSTNRLSINLIANIDKCNHTLKERYLFIIIGGAVTSCAGAALIHIVRCEYDLTLLNCVHLYNTKGLKLFS